MGSRSDVRVVGPLASYAPGLCDELDRRGYTVRSAQWHLRLMAELSRWLEAEGVDAGGFTSERVAQFCAARRSAGHTRLVTGRGLSPLLDLLRGLGVVPEPTPAVAVSAGEELLGRYRGWLVRERGLVERVVGQYEATARLFLSGVMPDGRLDLSGLSSADVAGFVTRECPLRGPSAAKHIASSLRSFLRFLHVQGHIGLPLAQAVPSVARRGPSSLPKALGSGQAARLLASCDRRSVIGRRDYAMLLLALRLGLRAGEIVALTLDDVDWRAGEIVVRGKGRCQERLPLPADVGEALAAYLRRGRPPTDHRTLFLRVLAPLGGLGAAAVSWAVYRACDRAGLPRVGAHRLRHTAATGMLRAGASLSDVGQVLRHRSAGTTAVYAKVDHGALGTLARPWPGGAA